MGTHTVFDGAIRIAPQIKGTLASRLSDWLRLRHMRRDVSILEELYPTEEEKKAHTLFGDGCFGEEGEFYLPDLTKEFEIWKIDFEENKMPEGLTDMMSINRPPKNCPNLYSDLVLAHSEDGAYSFLGWNGAEKPYNIPEWLRLIASYLVPLGYHLDGCLFADEEFGFVFYYVRVEDKNVTVELFEPEATYIDEFRDALFVKEQSHE